MSNVKDKELWNGVKMYVKDNYKEYGRWSAFKSAISVKLYKELVGRYTGQKNKDNKLKKWLDEKWTYISPNKKSKSYSKGRFLPSRVIKKMSNSLKKYENSKKKKSISSRVKYSKKLNNLMKKEKIY